MEKKTNWTDIQLIRSWKRRKCVDALLLDDDEEQCESPDKFELGHELVEKIVKLLSSLCSKNSWKKILMVLKVCSDYIC